MEIQAVLLALLALNAASAAWHDCGVPTISPPPALAESTPYIVNGVEATPHSFPWLLSLQTVLADGELHGHLCGASIVSDRWAVTAAHCIERGAKYAVMAGAHNLTATGETSRKVYDVKKASPHPKWSLMDYTAYDIAMLELATPITFNAHVAPVCLAGSYAHYPEGTVFTVAGWGNIDNVETAPDTLQQVEVPYISRARCNDLYYYGFVAQDAFCAGYARGGGDSCNGDSGGPLMVKRWGRWVLAGIVSWGLECGAPDLPGVYTDVSKYTSYIRGITHGQI